MTWVLCAAIGVSGCGPSGPTPEEILIRRQREREAGEASKPRGREQQRKVLFREFELGEYSRVESLARKFLVTYPDDVEVIFLAARAQAAGGQEQTAAETLLAIPDDDPVIGQVALSQGAKWLVAVGHYDEAIDRLVRMMQIHGETRRSRHELARLLNNAGRRFEAAEHLRALAREGDISEKELFSLMTLGSSFIDTTIPEPDFTSQITPAALAKARLLREYDDLSGAKRAAEQLNELFPDSTSIAAFLARVYSELHEDDALLESLSSAPQGIEQEPEYWYALGLLFQRQDQHDFAIRCFGEAVSRDETDRFSYLGMARSLELRGEQEAAQRVMHRFELLEEAARLNRRFGEDPGTIEQLHRVADILDELRRPWESIAWRSLAAKRANAPDSLFSTLRQRRQTLSREGDRRPQHWLTCGLDLSDWPLPTIADVQPNTSPIEPDSPVVDRPLRLVDVADRAGLTFQYVNRSGDSDAPFSIYQLNGGGIAVLDFDLDGWPDCYFSQAGGPPMNASASLPNQLFRNLAGSSFDDVSVASDTADRGYGQGVAAADINQDGFIDLMVANIGPNVLYLNQGDGTFARQELSAATRPDQWTTSIACGDLSGDHLPEIVEVNYIDDVDAFRLLCQGTSGGCSPSAYQPAADQILTVLPDGRLKAWDVAQSLSETLGHGFAAVVANIDGHSGNELYVANDTDPNHYWRVSVGSDPAETSTLVEAGLLFGCAIGVRGNRQGCMGVASGDLDRNGLMDFHVTNYWNQPSDLYLQQSGGMFSNATLPLGVGQGSIKTVGWGTQAVDLDRDGWLDLPVLNGHVVDESRPDIPYRMRPQLFRGGAKRFELASAASDAGLFWSTPTLGRTLAVIDWNRDGKPDLLANHLDVPVTLLENQTETQNWIQLELVGTESERDAIGAEIRLQAGDERWTSWVVGGDGFQCSNEPLVDFGMGNHERVTEVQITWPSGNTQRFRDLATDSRFLAIEGETDLFVR